LLQSAQNVLSAHSLYILNAARLPLAGGLILNVSLTGNNEKGAAAAISGLLDWPLLVRGRRYGWRLADTGIEDTSIKVRFACVLLRYVGFCNSCITKHHKTVLDLISASLNVSCFARYVLSRVIHRILSEIYFGNTDRYTE
jgi:hypothetical protein